MRCDCNNINPHLMNHDFYHYNTSASPAFMGAPHNVYHQNSCNYYMQLISVNQTLNLELRALKGELCCCLNENEKLKEENKKLNEKVEDLKKEIDDLKEGENKEPNCDTILSQLDIANKSNADLANKLDSLKTEIENSTTLVELEKIKSDILEKTYDSDRKNA